MVVGGDSPLPLEIRWRLPIRFSLSRARALRQLETQTFWLLFSAWTQGKTFREHPLAFSRRKKHSDLPRSICKLVVGQIPPRPCPPAHRPPRQRTLFRAEQGQGTTVSCLGSFAQVGDSGIQGGTPLLAGLGALEEAPALALLQTDLVLKHTGGSQWSSPGPR